MLSFRSWGLGVSCSLCFAVGGSNTVSKVIHLGPEGPSHGTVSLHYEDDKPWVDIFDCSLSVVGHTFERGIPFPIIWRVALTQGPPEAWEVTYNYSRDTYVFRKTE